MNGSACGFFIQSLTLRGPTKPDALLTFSDGLNVVAGASDTGKSFALSCIDFAFGASTQPRRIPELAGYETVEVELISRETGGRTIIQRGLAGGDVKLLRIDSSSGQPSEETVIPARHNASDQNTLSGVLLGLSQLWGKQIRTNKQGSRRTLSFRDLAFLCLVDEERIIAERPPQLSGNVNLKTVEGEVFRLLVTGRESGEVFSAPTKKQTIGTEAKLELLASMTAEAEAKFNALGLDRGTLEVELSSLEETRAAALAEYERSREEISVIESTLTQRALELREIQARQSVVEGLSQRFQLLDKHYEADLGRLLAIEESGSLLEALPSKICPVCGAPPDQHRSHDAEAQFNPTAVQIGARTEATKIKGLQSDLHKLLSELAAESETLEARRSQATTNLNAAQERLDIELMPRVKESAEALRNQNLRHDLLLQGKSAIGQLDQLRGHQLQLATTKTAQKAPTAILPSAPTTAEIDEFAAVVQSVLVAWRYPEPGRVVFSEEDQDLVIAGQPRVNHGKGVRALTCAAFIVGLLRHCRSKRLPHPSIVLLDSPLVAYREPDNPGSENEKLRRSGVKEAFYSSLAAGEALGQVIVFENEDPPIGLKGVNLTHFTKSDTGRYGFIPTSPKESQAGH